MSSHQKNLPENIVDSNKPILLTKEKSYFTVILEANPSTGYQWTYEKESSSEAWIESVKSTYQPSQSKQMGAPGKTVFTFQLKPKAFEKAHTFKIRLRYTRVWEKDPQDSKIEIDVITLPIEEIHPE
jgi:inhibitor of cysteine peptidase